MGTKPAVTFVTVTVRATVARAGAGALAESVADAVARTLTWPDSESGAIAERTDAFAVTVSLDTAYAAAVSLPEPATGA